MDECADLRPSVTAVRLDRAEGVPQFACLLLSSHHETSCQYDDGLEASWLSLCRCITPILAQVSPRCVLLDLGACSERAAQIAMTALRQRIERMGCPARVGIAPSALLAQLAALVATNAQSIVLIMPESARAFLRDVPVTALLRVQPAGRVPPEIVARLEGYGLRTLGHLARLGELALRRQFGAIGGFLAAVAAGRDERPLQPTPLPPALHARLGVGSGTTSERVLAALDLFAARVAARLHQQGRQARELRLRLRWECGCTERARLGLRAHTADGAMLTRELRRLLVPLLQAHAERAAASAASGDRLHAAALDGVWVIVSDFAPILPDQATFWRTRDQRQAAARRTAETLARRHGRPLLLRLEAARPAAIFDEECHQFAGLPGAERAGVAATPRRSPLADRSTTVPAAQADPWQAVPQRLHWW